MAAIGFLGSFAVSFCGIGPGAIFGIVFLLLDVDPYVATSTSMYVTMFTTLTATIQSIFFKKLMYEYAIYIVVISIFATFPGIFFQQYLRDITLRPSSNVGVLQLCSIIS